MLKDELSYSEGPAEICLNHTTELIESVFTIPFVWTKDLW